MDLNKLALFLGMLVGDGSISNRKNGFGYPTYSVAFWNTRREYVDLFSNLNSDLFDSEGKINPRHRPNKKVLYEFRIYSKPIFDYLVDDVGIPSGKKAAIVKIPKIILKSNNEVKKYFFLGLFLTDGGLNKRGNLHFHMASRELLLGLSGMIKDIWGFDKEVKNVIQKNKYFSYQLNLNMDESSVVLHDLCRDRIIWYCTDSAELVSLKCKP